MNTHNIIKTVYITPKPESGYPENAPVLVTKANGTTRSGYANDDIEGGGVLAFLADGGVIEDYVAPIVTREQWRKTATIPRADLVIGAASIGLLSNEEAVEAAKGGWPTSFNAALPNDDNAATKAKIVWATATEDIHRNANLILAIIASPIPITAEQMDTLFGYGA